MAKKTVIDKSLTPDEAFRQASMNGLLNLDKHISNPSGFRKFLDSNAWTEWDELRRALMGVRSTSQQQENWLRILRDEYNYPDTEIPAYLNRFPYGLRALTKHPQYWDYVKQLITMAKNGKLNGKGGSPLSDIKTKNIPTNITQAMIDSQIAWVIKPLINTRNDIQNLSTADLKTIWNSKLPTTTRTHILYHLNNKQLQTIIPDVLTSNDWKIIEAYLRNHKGQLSTSDTTKLVNHATKPAHYRTLTNYLTKLNFTTQELLKFYQTIQQKQKNTAYYNNKIGKQLLEKILTELNTNGTITLTKP